MEERDLRSKLEQVFLVGVEHFIDGRIISSSFHQGSRKKDWTSKGPVNEEVMLKHYFFSLRLRPSATLLGIVFFYCYAQHVQEVLILCERVCLRIRCHTWFASQPTGKGRIIGNRKNLNISHSWP